MKHLNMIAAAMTLVAIPTFAADSENIRRPAQDRINRAERREARQDVEQLIKDINTLDNQPAARRAGMAEAARQAAVPVARLEAQLKDQPGVNLGGLFLAHEIAKDTKNTPQDLLKTRMGGETWTQIAQKNRKDLTVLENKLTRIHEAMLDPDGTRARERDRLAAADRGRNRAQTTTGTGETPFGQSIQSVNALGQEQEAKRLGLRAIARETDLTRQQVEQAAGQHTQMGLGDLFVAQQLSLKTKKSINELWNLHLSPKSWVDIARENNVNERQLASQLARIEDTMRGRAAGVDDTQRVRERDRETRRDDSRIDAARGAFDEPSFQQSIQSVNSLGQDAKVQSAGLRALSRETAMPLPQVERAHRQHQNLGMGDLFVAQELSIKTKKSVDELWRLHLSPKTWAEVARDHNQDLGEIQRKLARIEQSLRDAGK